MVYLYLPIVHVFKVCVGGVVWIHSAKILSQLQYTSMLREASQMSRVGLVRTVYDRLFGNFPARNTIYIPYRTLPDPSRCPNFINIERNPG
jgi:hypothetical protein